MNIENGKLIIDVWSLLGQLSKEDHDAIIDSLACQDRIIDEVMNQVIDGFTKAGSHGATGYGGNPHASHGIDGARLRIAKASSEIAAREIERMSEAITRAEKSSQEAWSKYHELLEGRRYA